MGTNRFIYDPLPWDAGWFVEPGTDAPEEDSPAWMNDPSAAWLQLFDAFDSEGELGEPEPEDGDFWGEPDEEEIWA